MLTLKPAGKRPKNLKPGEFAVFDIEARGWIKHVVNGYFDGTTFRHFSTIKKFIDFLEVTPHAPKHVFSHFGGGYDFLFLFDHVLRTGRAEVANIIARGGSILFFDLVFPSGRTVTFRDSSAILPFALRKLAEDFNVATKKGEIDYARIRKITKRLLEYLESDCRALYECLAAYFATPLIERAGPAFTSASQAMRIFRCYLKKPIRAATAEADAFVRGGYFGGRVEIFRPYFKSKKGKLLHVYDVNSLYPAVMRENEFPTQEGSFTRARKRGGMYFADVTVKVPEMYIPPLPFYCPERRKLIFPTGIFRGTYAAPELEYAESLGVKILKTHRVLPYRSGGKIFREFIDEMYKIRLENKAGTVLNFTAKTAMNSLYGRMGLNLDKEELKIMGSIEDFENLDEYRRFNFGKREVKILKGKKRLNSFSQVAIAAWVTALARVKMHRYLLASRQGVWYLDTDSLFTPDKMPTGAGLGALKHEYDVREAAFVLPKTYGVLYARRTKGKQKKLVMKGFENKKLKKVPFSAFYEALQGDLRGLKISTDPRHLKFRSALKKRKFLVLGKKSIKRIKSVYDKREIIPAKTHQWETKPWKIEGKEKWQKTKTTPAAKTLHGRSKRCVTTRDPARSRGGFFSKSARS